MYSLLQKCVTPFGKRLFRVWLCHPLRDAEAINARLDAVEEIMNHSEFMGAFKKLSKGVSSLVLTRFICNALADFPCFSGLPDLERLISRIHAGNCKVAEFLSVLKVRPSLVPSHHCASF